MDRLLLQGISLAEKLRNRRMRNRLYGGVRGQVNTKGGEHLQLVFTFYSIAPLGGIKIENSPGNLMIAGGVSMS